MPMSGLLLGLAFDLDANASNPLALVASAPAWAAIASAWVGHMDSNMTFGPAGLVCPLNGGPLTGSASLGGSMSASVLGTALATAALAPASAPQWTPIAKAFIDYVIANASVSPSTTLLAPAGTPTAGGLITGTGVISGIVSDDLGDAMSKAAGTFSDPTSKAAWRAMAADLKTQIQSTGVAVPGTLKAAPSGGPIAIGVGAIS